MIAVTVTVSCRNVRATTFEDLAGSIADTAGIGCSHAVVHIVTNAIAVGIGCAITAANPQDVVLIAIAVAVSSGDIGASTVVNLAGSVADATGVEGPDAIVHIIAYAITVRICRAVSATIANDVIEETRCGGGVREVTGTQI